MNRKRAFTLIELLVVMAIIALLLSLLLPALAKARAAARQVKDGTQLTQVHKGWLIWSGDFEGTFPTPGLIRRQKYNGKFIPGRGEEDVTANNHANLYSACIMANYMSPQLLVSPSEASGKVVAASNYNYNKYNVASDSDPIYWDNVFKTDLTSLCNTSYGTMPLSGIRKAQQWKNSLDSKHAVVGNRGVKDGDLNQAVYNASKTLEIHGTRKKWEGNICFNDNHVKFLDTFFPEGIDYKSSTGENQPDNLFKEDANNGGVVGGASDIWLCMVKEMSGNPVQPQVTWD